MSSGILVLHGTNESVVSALDEAYGDSFATDTDSLERQTQSGSRLSALREGAGLSATKALTTYPAGDVQLDCEVHPARVAAHSNCANRPPARSLTLAAVPHLSLPEGKLWSISLCYDRSTSRD